VTGVSRREGIGWATVQRLAKDGATVFTHGWSAHDAEQPWGADEGFDAGAYAGHLEVDLAEPGAPARLVEAAVAAAGPLDVLIANHAASGDQNLEQLTAEVIDHALTVNVRATLLLVQAFAAQAERGRVILLTSGQGRGPMARELPYVASKAALTGLVTSLADHLAPRGITVNAVNPGPTDTGWATAEIVEQARAAMPRGRWGTPDDAARLIAWLASEDADWVTGQVIDSDGGFRYGGA
jgi:3-oxoacyl-[acyl-carrier protein] reductase